MQMSYIVDILIPILIILYIVAKFVISYFFLKTTETSSSLSENSLDKSIINAKERMFDDPKLQSWVEIAEKVPQETTTPAMPSLKDASKILNTTIYKQDKAKTCILGVIARYITNPSSLEGSVIGFKGPAGVGKTTLAKKGLSKALGLPYASIPLAGSSKQGDDLLKGHSYSYVGSHCGRILQALIHTKTRNPILFFDELDKCDESAQNALINITDAEHAHEFTDRYLGYPIDISQSIIIFAYNDTENVNPILLDRLTEVRFNEYTTEDKIEIMKQFTIDKMKNRYNIEITVSHDAIRSIVNHMSTCASIRRLEDALDRSISQKLINKLHDVSKVFSIHIDRKDVVIAEEDSVSHIHMYS
jgi:ATP-dependent Lon protease